MADDVNVPRLKTRIAEATRRVVGGLNPQRIPADENGDVDLVLSECDATIDALLARLADAERERSTALARAKALEGALLDVTAERDRWRDDVSWSRRLLRRVEHKSESLPWSWWPVDGGVALACQCVKLVMISDRTINHTFDRGVPLIDEFGKVGLSVVWRECGCATFVRLDKYRAALEAR